MRPAAAPPPGGDLFGGRGRGAPAHASGRSPRACARETLDEVVGQPALLGPDGRPARGDRGRPGALDDPLRAARAAGKTTLARVVAARDRRPPSRSSRPSRPRVADVRAVMARARDRLAAGTRTVLFLDEIHRFNRAQQDALLPAVEDGLVTLIGATTQNPWYEVNAALVSRMRVLGARAAGRRGRSARLLDRARRRPARAGRAGAPGRGGAGGDRRARRRRRARGAQPAGGRGGRHGRTARRSPSRPSSRRPAGGRSSTTARATPTTTRSRPSSRACAAATRTRRSTTWP